MRLHVSLLDLNMINKFFPREVDRICKPSDYAVLLGAIVKKTGNCEYWTKELFNADKTEPKDGHFKIHGFDRFRETRRPVALDDKISLTSALEEVSPMIVNDDGSLGWDFPNMRDKAIKIVIPAKELISICPEARDVKENESFQSNLEYPQSVVDSALANKLDMLYVTLQKTGKLYTADSGSTALDEKNYNRPYSERKFSEFLYEDVKYIKVDEARPYDNNSVIYVDGNSHKVREGNPYYVEVEKVCFTKFQFAPGEEYFVSDLSLLAGIQMDTLQNYAEVYKKSYYASRETLRLSEHSLGMFLENNFAVELLPSVAIEMETAKKSLFSFQALPKLKGAVEYVPQHVLVPELEKV